MLLAMVVIAHGQPQHKVDNDGRKQGNSQDCRTKPVIETTLSPHPYTPCAPVESEQRVYHGHHGNEGEEAGGDFSDLVAEVQEADCEAAEDDGEVEPGEESTLVGEEDLGLDSRGEGDALAWETLLESCYVT
jgi:hypothetical protein